MLGAFLPELAPGCMEDRLVISDLSDSLDLSFGQHPFRERPVAFGAARVLGFGSGEGFLEVRDLGFHSE